MKRKVIVVVSIAALSLLVISTGAVFAGEIPKFSVTNLTAAGSGCSAGSVSLGEQSDAGFTIKLKDFAAQSTPGKSLSAGRKFCQISATVTAPSGWQYSVDNLTVSEVSVDLVTGTGATVKASTYFQGERATKSAEKKWRGPLNWRGKLSLDLRGGYSACQQNRAVNIKIDLRAMNRKEPTGVAINGKAVVGLMWRKCQN